MNNAISAQEALCQFRDAMRARNIIPPENLLADGKIHRCDTAGTNGKKNGKNDAAYLLHLDGIPAGGFENHQDGLGWQDWCANIGRTLTAAEKAAQNARIAEAQAARKAEEAKRHEEARKKADAIWQQTEDYDSHPYIYRKGIAGAYGVRVIRADIAAKILGYEPLPVRDKNGKPVRWLVLPVHDANGTLHGLQFIDEDGEKRFLYGTRKQGCYFAIGKPDGKLCIAEGFATAASIHEATGYAAAVAFDAGNLKPVAEALRAKFPGLRLVLCADDDRTEGKPGITRATEAARAVGGLLTVPIFGEKRPNGAKDFNDLHQHAGKEAVKRCIDAAKPVEGAQVPASGDSVPFNYGNGRFEASPKGVFFIEADKDGEERPIWICSPLYVRAETRDANSKEWGRLLEWHDDDQVRHKWAMPLELLQGDGSDVRRELARQGLRIAPSKKARDLLAVYLQVCKVEKRARCVERLGWHGAVYVTPEQTIGQDDEIVEFQNAHAIKPAFAISGTAEEWRDSVAALASGNSRLVFALSVAFAGALADIVGEDSGGFHLRGASSTGKSTVLKAAASVWGNPSDYPRTWRATANGLEGLAALHNDGLLILDELSQIDPKEAGEAAYLLANGQGKARATRTGAARQSARWRLLFLSAGEVSLADLMTQAGKKTNAGQEIRLADIEIDAGADMGAFEALHAKPDPNAFSLAVKDAATRYHGAVGIEWLHKIVAHRSKLADFTHENIQQFVKECVPPGASGQVQRVARRFALVAVAGELATHYGLTGWKENEAIDAAQKCFAAWLEAFGTGNRDERALLEQVKAFFEAHGSSRFGPINTEQRIPNQTGFYRDDHGELQYLVLPEAFKKEVCKGFDSKTAAKVLVKAGWLEPGEENRAAQNVRIPCLGKTTRCYVFTGRMWEGE